MLEIRKNQDVFLNTASVSTRETCDPCVLCLVRELNGEKLIALFNFAPTERTAWISEDGMYQDLLSHETLCAKDVHMPPYAIRWMLLVK